MQRYFLENHQRDDQYVTITGEDFHHIVNVMRMKPGDQIAVVFRDERVALCKISHIGKRHVTAVIVNWRQDHRELPVEVTIGSALLKGDKFDMVIQKGTELGVKRIIPFQAERSVVKMDGQKGMKKRERWQKIAKEAAEQSERSTIPDIGHPCSAEECLELARSYKWKLVAYEKEARNGETGNFFRTLQQVRAGDNLFMLFGPEGGFSEREVERFKEEGFTFVGLGPRILRAETAPLYALSAISFYFELSR